MAKFKWVGKRRYPKIKKELTELRCIYPTRVIVPPDKTMTGTRYDFQPDEVKSVEPQDAPLLLALTHYQTSCCGGVTPQELKYFTMEV